MVRDRCNYFSFWATSCPNSLKNQNFQKMKKERLEILSLYTVYKNWWLDDVWFLRYGVWQTDGRTDEWRDGKGDI